MQAAAARYIPISVSVFALCERKNRNYGMKYCSAECYRASWEESNKPHEHRDK
jgi:hypothetical protein